MTDGAFFMRALQEAHKKTNNPDTKGDGKTLSSSKEASGKVDVSKLLAGLEPKQSITEQAQLGFEKAKTIDGSNVANFSNTDKSPYASYATMRKRAEEIARK